MTSSSRRRASNSSRICSSQSRRSGHPSRNPRQTHQQHQQQLQLPQSLHRRYPEEGPGNLGRIWRIFSRIIPQIWGIPVQVWLLILLSCQTSHHQLSFLVRHPELLTRRLRSLPRSPGPPATPARARRTSTYTTSASRATRSSQQTTGRDRLEVCFPPQRELIDNCAINIAHLYQFVIAGPHQIFNEVLFRFLFSSPWKCFVWWWICQHLRRMSQMLADSLCPNGPLFSSWNSVINVPSRRKFLP